MEEGRRPILRSGRLFLRPAERDDIPTFLDWLADAEVSDGLANRTPSSRVAEERWFDDMQKEYGKSLWHFVTCLRDGRPIGFAGPHSIERERQHRAGHRHR